MAKKFEENTYLHEEFPFEIVDVAYAMQRSNNQDNVVNKDAELSDNNKKHKIIENDSQQKAQMTTNTVTVKRKDTLTESGTSETYWKELLIILIVVIGSVLIGLMIAYPVEFFGTLLIIVFCVVWVFGSK